MRTLKRKWQQADGGWNQNWKYPPNSSQFLHFLFFDISYPGSMAVQNPEQSAGYAKKQLQEMPSIIYLFFFLKIFSPYGEIPYFHLFCFSFLSSPSPQTVHQQLQRQRQSSRYLKPWGRGTLMLVRETDPQDTPILFFFFPLSLLLLLSPRGAQSWDVYSRIELLFSSQRKRKKNL